MWGVWCIVALMVGVYTSGMYGVVINPPQTTGFQALASTLSYYDTLWGVGIRLITKFVNASTSAIVTTSSTNYNGIGICTFQNQGNEELWITADDGNLYYYPNSNNLATFTPYRLSGTPTDVATFDGQTFYISFYLQNRISVYSRSSNFAAPLYNISNLNYPKYIRPYQNNGFWVANSRSAGQALYFPANSGSPSRTISSFNNNNLGEVTSVAINTNGSTLWLTDTTGGRILQYTNIMSGTPQQDTVDLSLTFKPWGVVFDPTTGFLWVSSQNVSTIFGTKLEAGIPSATPSKSFSSSTSLSPSRSLSSTPTTSPSYSSSPTPTPSPSPLIDYVINETVFRFNISTLFIPGNLTILNFTVVVIESNQTISTIGCVNFAGALNVTIPRFNGTRQPNTTIEPISYGCHSGQFTSINVIQEGDSDGDCQQNIVPTYGGNSLSLLYQGSTCPAGDGDNGKTC
eukprot:TRINITY_DN23026_c0_g1_i2.p1 TRINITY_DN23026_c0_g1~~TRINITY_DN23026_c0_g1_i2.p1  ORF type:complete len:465 (-),score=64.23 TRINITY_DN23026_c0_g1_i2:92-1465(-)